MSEPPKQLQYTAQDLGVLLWCKKHASHKLYLAQKAVKEPGTGRHKVEHHNQCCCRGIEHHETQHSWSMQDTRAKSSRACVHAIGFAGRTQGLGLVGQGRLALHLV